MRIYEAIFGGLESIGVDAAFGGAGENAAGAMIALKHSKKIRPIVTRHEQAAAFAACGYATLEWGGKGSLNETSGLNRTPDSQKMFCATTKKSWLLKDVNQTMDVLEQAVNVAFEGRPGPVHIHVPENLMHHGVEVTNYRDLKLKE